MDRTRTCDRLTDTALQRYRTSMVSRGQNLTQLNVTVKTKHKSVKANVCMPTLVLDEQLMNSVPLENSIL